MGQFFKSVRFKVIVCIAAFFLGIALFSVTKDGIASGGSQTVNTVLNPIRKFSNAISDKVSLVVDLFINAEDYEKENQELRQKISSLNARLIEYEDMKSEIEDLRKFIGIKEEKEDLKLSPPCTIISRVANDPYGTFVIDKGTKDGIKLYDPVVTSEGLVGIIVEVAKSYSTVQTILSPETSVGGLCVESRDTGIVEGSLSYAAEGKCKMIYIDKENSIKEGDLIITSGNSGQFPQGYVIGYVTETGIEESGLNAYAVIKPAVDISKINTVMVITDFDRSERENTITPGDLGTADDMEDPTEAETEPASENSSGDSSSSDDVSADTYSDDVPEDDNSDDSSSDDDTGPETDNEDINDDSQSETQPQDTSESGDE
ncbi:MAG: rod shape-determining protein MreC [Porcipelethomonas sp.]